MTLTEPEEMSHEFKKIGHKLSLIQNALGYSNQQMADILRTSVSNYMSYRNGNVRMTSTAIILLIHDLNVNPSYFLHDGISSEIFIEDCEGTVWDKMREIDYILSELEIEVNETEREQVCNRLIYHLYMMKKDEIDKKG